MTMAAVEDCCDDDTDYPPCCSGTGDDFCCTPNCKWDDFNCPEDKQLPYVNRMAFWYPGFSIEAKVKFYFDSY